MKPYLINITIRSENPLEYLYPFFSCSKLRIFFTMLPFMVLSDGMVFLPIH